MSESAHEAINLDGRPRERDNIGMLFQPPTLFAELHFSSRCAGTNRNVTQSAQNQTSQGQSNFSDGSGPTFNMYNKMREEEDNKISERWQKDADGILIFVSSHIRLHALN
jgi:hypothetical protein